MSGLKRSIEPVVPQFVPYLLAPMATLTHRAFREILELYGGCDEYYSEMIGAAPFLHGGRFESYYADPLPRPDKLVYQIVGGDGERLKKAATILNDRQTRGVDINMGCSAPEIVKDRGGVWWMSHEEEAKTMIGGVRKVVSSRLSVKLRLGQTENFDQLVQFCRMLQAEGVEALVLHPRTATEKFRRQARWDYVSLLKNELHIPVSGNGDVDSAETLVQRGQSNCSGVMVGRAAVREPWIFAAARQKESGVRTLPDHIDLAELAYRFLDLLVRHQPPEFYETRAKRFFNYYCDNLKWAHHVKTLINREKEPGRMRQVLLSYFEQSSTDRFKPSGLS